MLGNRAIPRCGVFILLAVNLASDAFGQCELQAIEGATGFAHFVAIDGDRAVVTSAGGPIVYRFDEKASSWVMEAQLVGEGAVLGDSYGACVDIDGETAVVAAPGDDTLAPNAGAVYVFQRDSRENRWVQEAKIPVLLPLSAHVINQKCIVEVLGDVVAVRKDGTAVHLFRRSATTGQWVADGVLTPTIGNYVEGNAVALSNGLVFIGSHTDVGPGCYGTGTCVHYDYVDVYAYDSRAALWTIQSTLFGQNPAFGAAIAVRNDVASIGGVAMQGSVFSPAAEIFRSKESDVWLAEASFDGSGLNNFLYQTRWLSTDGQAVVLGDVFDLSDGAKGSAHVLVFDQEDEVWLPAIKLMASNGSQTQSSFGISTGVSNGRIIVGAVGLPLYQQPGPGWVYFYDLNQADCNDNGLCDSRDIAEGSSIDKNANGIPDECEAVLGDADGNGAVNADDLLLVINSWGLCTAPCAADLTGDGIVDQIDLEIVLVNWTDQA